MICIYIPLYHTTTNILCMMNLLALKWLPVLVEGLDNFHPHFLMVTNQANENGCCTVIHLCLDYGQEYEEVTRMMMIGANQSFHSI